jgi:hypothetical protein
MSAQSDYKYHVKCHSEDKAVLIDGFQMKIKSSAGEHTYQMNSAAGLETMAEKAVYLFDAAGSARLLTVERIELLSSLQRETSTGFHVEYKSIVDVNIVMLDKTQNQFLTSFKAQLVCSDVYKDVSSKELVPDPSEKKAPPEFNEFMY